ncbi:MULTISPECIES: hypothetical protein [unclassified Paenibacillus]|uniref:hypothetical protein n=1 Tax=unclassified Paenibacillus TaxID=185978 RepID=UPI00240753B5|nr:MULTISPECIES: hypothetical protein [unclassified Paenibacillus]MDF9843657.1 hypothetical protein [Paenibacillus sp. PastF-2]MDF9850245.1 hypothetical protein [Paenibacillus sp. PastM-2]MDF9856815.1 hypothetical protein [Paenibacillus sp. PastF-1]MDH6482092.1 hypothetical protein [Paenibacillus sp. PastH-2]MDH6509515.1 hypothetical protein [Paenibacillus sp. PastM-3]
MRKANRKTSWISRVVAGGLILQLAAPGIQGTAADAVYEIVNPGFETGGLTGWTVTKGNAFGPDSVSGESTWWAEQIPYNQEGTYR